MPHPYQLFERLGVAHLQRRGFDLVAFNFRAGRTQVDAFMRRGETLFAVEVKFRKQPTDRPEEVLRPAQLERLMRAGAGMLGSTGCVELAVLLLLYHPGDERPREFVVNVS